MRTIEYLIRQSAKSQIPILVESRKRAKELCDENKLMIALGEGMDQMPYPYTLQDIIESRTNKFNGEVPYYIDYDLLFKIRRCLNHIHRTDQV